jgi:hypothetical protein
LAGKSKAELERLEREIEYKCLVRSLAEVLEGGREIRKRKEVNKIGTIEKDWDDWEELERLGGLDVKLI